MNQSPFTLKALGTQWWIEIFDEVDQETRATAFDRCARFIANFENNYSRFRLDSLVSIINRNRSLEKPTAELCDVLAYGKNLYLRTNTHFNLLTGHIQEAHGYDTEYSFTSTINPSPAGNPVTDLTIQTDQITLTHGNIDIGGYGKGYLIDELANILRSEFSIQYFLINGGGDMFGTSKFEQPIEVFLEHPLQPQHFIGKTNILNQGFAASSPFKRFWETEEGTFSHIITNEKIPQLASFIKATTARDADAFATTALLITENQLQQLVQNEFFSVSRFNPADNTLWQTGNFSISLI